MFGFFPINFFVGSKLSERLMPGLCFVQKPICVYSVRVIGSMKHVVSIQENNICFLNVDICTVTF